MRGWEKEGVMKQQLLLKKSTRNRYPIYDQNGGKIAKIDTQFMTKTAFGASLTYIAHIREYPPPPGGRTLVSLFHLLQSPYNSTYMDCPKLPTLVVNRFKDTLVRVKFQLKAKFHRNHKFTRGLRVSLLLSFVFIRSWFSCATNEQLTRNI